MEVGLPAWSHWVFWGYYGFHSPRGRWVPLGLVGPSGKGLGGLSGLFMQLVWREDTWLPPLEGHCEGIEPA